MRACIRCKSAPTLPGRSSGSKGQESRAITTKREQEREGASIVQLQYCECLTLSMSGVKYCFFLIKLSGF